MLNFLHGCNYNLEDRSNGSVGGAFALSPRRINLITGHSRLQKTLGNFFCNLTKKWKLIYLNFQEYSYRKKHSALRPFHLRYRISNSLLYNYKYFSMKRYVLKKHYSIYKYLEKQINLAIMLTTY